MVSDCLMHKNKHNTNKVTKVFCEFGLLEFLYITIVSLENVY